ncbi:MAG: PAS domain-containing protein [Acidobacteriota bacterium]|nr:PAS domain-containing protein [Acidobacteriota bacterium]
MSILSTTGKVLASFGIDFRQNRQPIAQDLDNANRRITDANPYMTELLGYTLDEFLGKDSGKSVC